MPSSLTKFWDKLTKRKTPSAKPVSAPVASDVSDEEHEASLKAAGLHPDQKRTPPPWWAEYDEGGFLKHQPSANLADYVEPEAVEIHYPPSGATITPHPVTSQLIPAPIAETVPQEKTMSFLSTIGKDFKAVFAWLGSSTGQTTIAAGEGVAESVATA